MLKIKLINTFHNREVTIRVEEKNREVFGNQICYRISKTTYYKIKSELCGATGCLCNTTYGDKRHWVDKHYDGTPRIIEC